MTLALVDAAPLVSTTDPASTTHTIDIDTVSAKAVGDWLLFISVRGATSSPLYQWSDRTAQDYTALLDNGFAGLHLSYVYVTAALAAATTLTVTTGSQESATHVFHLRGGNLEWQTPRFAHTVSGGTTTSPDPPSLTPGYGAVEYIWIAGVYHFNTGSTSAGPAGYGTLTSTETGGATGVGLATAHLTSTAASEDPGAFTWGTARTAGQFTIGLPTAEPATP